MTGLERRWLPVGALRAAASKPAHRWCDMGKSAHRAAMHEQVSWLHLASRRGAASGGEQARAQMVRHGEKRTSRLLNSISAQLRMSRCPGYIWLPVGALRAAASKPADRWCDMGKSAHRAAMHEQVSWLHCVHAVCCFTVPVRGRS